jgi:hypothetical protein
MFHCNSSWRNSASIYDLNNVIISIGDDRSGYIFQNLLLFSYLPSHMGFPQAKKQFFQLYFSDNVVWCILDQFIKKMF